MTVLWLIVSNFLIELSHFFNKAVLNLPPSHFLLSVRIFTLGFFAIVVCSELYDYTRIKHQEKKITFGLIIFHMIILAEIILFLSNYPTGFFNKPTPLYIKSFWMTVLFLSGGLFLYTVYNNRKKMVKN